MEHGDFRIGMEFTTASGRWRCTDVGTRTVVAIKTDDPGSEGWLEGPPYAVAETVFDENDFGGCEPVPEKGSADA